MKKKPKLVPRIIRVGQAYGYLGVDRNRFNSEFRPYLTVIQLGKQAIGFDRIELDALADHIVATQGRPGRAY